MSFTFVKKQKKLSPNFFLCDWDKPECGADHFGTTSLSQNSTTVCCVNKLKV